MRKTSVECHNLEWQLSNEKDVITSVVTITSIKSLLSLSLQKAKLQKIWNTMRRAKST